MSVLIWVQTVCNGNQLMTKVAVSKERVKNLVLEKDHTNLIVLNWTVYSIKQRKGF